MTGHQQDAQGGETGSTSTSSPKRSNPQKDSESPKKRKKSDSKKTLAQLIEFLNDVEDLNELQKNHLKDQLSRMVKVPPFSKLSWSQLRTIFKDTRKMELPAQMPSSLKQFTEVVNGGIDDSVSPPYHLPSPTIGNLMGRAFEVVVTLHPNINEAAKFVIFDSIFMLIIRLFNGAITTLPESPVTEEERPFQPKGFADHKTFSLGGISIIFVELKRHLVDVEGLTQLLAEMLAARQDNAKNGIDLDIYGILTDCVRYFFVVLDAKAMRFRVKADLEAEFKNGRFDDNIMLVINMIFSILLTSVHDALGFTKTISEMRSHVVRRRLSLI